MSYLTQKTIKNNVSFNGVALHSGLNVNICIKPAEPNFGIVFKRVDCKINNIDQYNRYIAICFTNETNLNQEMVKKGWATAYRYYSLDYVLEEENARINKEGIWRGTFEDPYEFRKNYK